MKKLFDDQDDIIDVMHKILLLMFQILIFIFIIMSCIFFSIKLLTKANSKEVGYILSCTDGDTVKFTADNGKTIKTIRVLGVDTFESRKNKQAKKQAKMWGMSVKSKN